MINRINIIIILCLLMFALNAQERPFIWVTNSERISILEKIEKQPWAASFYQSFSERVFEDFSKYQNDPHAFLMGMLLDFENAKPEVSPPLKKINYSEGGGKSNATRHMRYLQVGIDCGIMYYLTQEDIYAQCALDILNAYVVGFSQIELDKDTKNGGWLYDGHLREAREIGAQVPMIYDFVSPYIKKGGKPYDLGKKAKVDFPQELAQQVFRTYVLLAIERGHTGSNWSVLESPSMVQNLLALEDEGERKKYLEVFLTGGSDRQDPLTVIAGNFQLPGDVYPETSQYSSGVASLTTHLLTILTKYDPSLHLGQKYTNVPMALSRWEDMKYPNGELVRFGDGHREGGTSFSSCDAAYYLGKIDSVPELVKKNGVLINTAIFEGKYKRGKLEGRSFGAHPYFDPLDLLWFSDEIDGNIDIIEQPRTDNLRHAALFLQRNLSETRKAEDGLMCFVGGASMVHGHANGMNMELYGKGQVLGAEQGRVGYGNEMHENYSRLFAAHNTVIVNGSSQSEGDWANLGINPVQLICMEPMPKQEAVSPYHSFTQTSFEDDKGDLAEAYQQRTMALIRTSQNTGYYVDVFRSKSKLPNEYHDYLYHNIGDKVEFLNGDLKFKNTPDRYMANANLPWKGNSTFRHPGWHYFQNVQTSQMCNGDVMARFSVEKLDGKPIYMNMHIIGEQGREYTRVLAPFTSEAPAPYDNKPTPTIVIRKNGEAWNSPFLVVYEPFGENKENCSVQRVEKILQNDIYKGLKIISKTKTQNLVQYVITQSKKQVFEDKELQLKFEGTFAIITTNEFNDLLNIYIGNGEYLKYKNTELISKNKEDRACYVDFSSLTPVLIRAENWKVHLIE